MAATWTYSDYITYEIGTLTRLQRLRLHIREVADRLGAIKRYTVTAFSVEKPELEQYLAQLIALEKKEASLAGSLGATSAKRFGWSRGRLPQ